MFFDNDAMSFGILDVIYLNQTNVGIFNAGRNFNALSFRFHSDAILKTKDAEYRMSDNSVAYVPARLDYDRRADKDELIVIHFETSDYRARGIEVFIPSEPPVLADLFREIYECWNKKEAGYKYECSAILCKIFAACYRENFRSEPAGSKIRASLDYIAENYRKSDLSLKEIADRSFMSEVYFRRLFKKEYGVSPQKYIIGLRIQNAVGLICSGCYSLKEIAYMSGYNDYKYFSVEFKKNVGVSPSKYIYNFKCIYNF